MAEDASSPLSPTSVFDTHSRTSSAKDQADTHSSADFAGPGDTVSPQSRDVSPQPSRDVQVWTPDAEKTAAQLAMTNVMASKMTGAPGRSDAATAAQQAPTPDADIGTRPNRAAFGHTPVVLKANTKRKAAAKSGSRRVKRTARDWKRTVVCMCEETVSLGFQDHLVRR